MQGGQGLRKGVGGTRRGSVPYWPRWGQWVHSRVAGSPGPACMPAASSSPRGAKLRKAPSSAGRLRRCSLEPMPSLPAWCAGTAPTSLPRIPSPEEGKNLARMGATEGPLSGPQAPATPVRGVSPPVGAPLKPTPPRTVGPASGPAPRASAAGAPAQRTSGAGAPAQRTSGAGAPAQRTSGAGAAPGRPAPAAGGPGCAPTIAAGPSNGNITLPLSKLPALQKEPSGGNLGGSGGAGPTSAVPPKQGHALVGLQASNRVAVDEKTRHIRPESEARALRRRLWPLMLPSRWRGAEAGCVLA
jgi:hypothetical protein